MIINHSLASLFLRNAREKIKQRGWAGYEHGIFRPEDFRFHDTIVEDEYDYIEKADKKGKKRPITGIDAIRRAMQDYERLATPFGTRYSWDRRGEVFVWPIRSATLNAHNLAVTYYCASLSEMFEIRMGREPALLRYSGGYKQGNYSQWLGKDDILKAFDFAEASVRAQVRSYPHLVTMAPLEVKRYKEELLAMGLSADKLLKLESEMWQKDQLEGDGPKRKITVKENE